MILMSIFLPSIVNDLLESDPKMCIEGLSADSTEEDIAIGFTNSLCLELKKQLEIIERLNKEGYKQIYCIGSLALFPDFIKMLANILQIPVITFSDINPYIIGSLNQVVINNQQKVSFKWKKKMTQTVPELDPISSYARYQSWASFAEKLNPATS